MSTSEPLISVPFPLVGAMSDVLAVSAITHASPIAPVVTLDTVSVGVLEVTVASFPVSYFIEPVVVDTKLIAVA